MAKRVELLFIVVIILNITFALDQELSNHTMGGLMHVTVGVDGEENIFKVKMENEFTPEKHMTCSSHKIFLSED